MPDFAWGHFWMGVIVCVGAQFVFGTVAVWWLFRDKTSFQNENSAVDKVEPPERQGTLYIVEEIDGAGVVYRARYYDSIEALLRDC